MQVTDAATGAYRVTLLDNVLHALGPNDENDATAALQYSITDADGSTVNGTLTVTFDDDAPSATANLAVQLDDDALAGGNPGGVGDVAPDTANTTGTLAHVYGADGAGTTLLTAAGSLLPTGFTAAVSNGGLTLTISQGATAVLQIQLTDTISGGYTVTQLAAIDHPVAGTEDNLQFTVGYVATDGDGDTATGSLSIDVDDDTPTVSANLPVQLDDDALGGNAGGDGDVDPDTANTTGTLAHSYGADGAGTTLLTAAGSLLPAGFTAVVSNGGLTLTISQGATAVLQIQLTDTISGGYTVTQLAAIDHPVAGTEDNLQFTVGYVATDGDGDTATGSLSIDVDDDTPTAAAEASQDVPEGTTVTGTLDFAGGADGATVTHIDGTLLVFNPADEDYSQAIDIGSGLIKVKADGCYSFTADAVTTPVPRTARPTR